jgi:acetyl-CoA carboxylase biotin carboxyl carrier protein
MSEKKRIVDQDLIRELAELLTETGLTEIEIDHDGARIRVVRGGTPGAVHAPVVTTPQAGSTEATRAAAAALEPATHAGMVPSPMVGTAYLSPEPGARPYVDIGDKVSQGQTLLIVEAMKTMNQIPAPRSGTITSIMVEDGQPVEYGEPLMIIE